MQSVALLNLVSNQTPVKCGIKEACRMSERSRALWLLTAVLRDPFQKFDDGVIELPGFFNQKQMPAAID